MVKSAPAGDTGSIPGLGRFHMPQGTEACGSLLVSPCFETKEATAMRSPQTTTREEPLLPATRESPHAVTETHSSQK